MFIIKLTTNTYYCFKNDSKVTKSKQHATKINLTKVDAEQYLNYKKRNSYTRDLFKDAVLEEI